MSEGHEGQSRKVKEGQQHFFSVLFFQRVEALDLQCAKQPAGQWLRGALCTLALSWFCLREQIL